MGRTVRWYSSRKPRCDVFTGGAFSIYKSLSVLRGSHEEGTDWPDDEVLHMHCLVLGAANGLSKTQTRHKVLSCCDLLTVVQHLFIFGATARQNGWKNGRPAVVRVIRGRELPKASAAGRVKRRAPAGGMVALFDENSNCITPHDSGRRPMK